MYIFSWVMHQQKVFLTSCFLHNRLKLKIKKKIEYAKFVVFVVTIKINKTTLTFSYIKLIKLIFRQIDQNKLRYNTQPDFLKN